MKNIKKTFTFTAFAALFAMTTQASASTRIEIELDGVASQADSIPVIVRGQDGPLGIVLVKPAHDGLIRFELDLPLDQPYCIKIPGFTSDAMFEAGLDGTCRLRLIPGDVDGDNLVGFEDFLILSKCYGTSSKDANYLESADFNGDGFIDIADYALLSSNYGMRGSVPGSFVPWPYPGDIDGDGVVGMGDFKVLEKSWGATIKDSHFDESADLNQDGSIDIADYAILSHAWGSVYPAH